MSDKTAAPSGSSSYATGVGGVVLEHRAQDEFPPRYYSLRLSNPPADYSAAWDQRSRAGLVDDPLDPPGHRDPAVDATTPRCDHASYISMTMGIPASTATGVQMSTSCPGVSMETIRL